MHYIPANIGLHACILTPSDARATVDAFQTDTVPDAPYLGVLGLRPMRLAYRIVDVWQIADLRPAGAGQQQGAAD